MRKLCGILVGFLLVGTLLAQTGNENALDRFKIPYFSQKYPQKTPQETLNSVVKVIAANNYTYLMAQLADPMFVDQRVEKIKSTMTGPDEARTLVAFDELVKETARHLRSDPLLIQELNQFAQKGSWKINGNSAVATLPDVQSRVVNMKQIQGRWYLENRR